MYQVKKDKNNGILFLSGGGDENISRTIDRQFVKCLLATTLSPEILYIPLALNRDHLGFERAYDWFSGVVSAISQDFIPIKMWTDISAKPDKINNYAAIYIGGGNTYKLLRWIDTTGFGEDLKRYYNNGGIIYGGSAGAIILGKDIRTVEPENSNINYQHHLGLDFLHGYSAICHFQDQMKSELSTLTHQIKTPILCLPEGAGIQLTSKRKDFVSIGEKPYSIMEYSVK